MADVNSFIDQLGNDVSATYIPTVEAFVQDLGKQIGATAGPRVGQFIEQLVTDLFAQQSKPIRDFLTKLTKDMAGCYHPSVNGRSRPDSSTTASKSNPRTQGST